MSIAKGDILNESVMSTELCFLAHAHTATHPVSIDFYPLFTEHAEHQIRENTPSTNPVGGVRGGFPPEYPTRRWETRQLNIVIAEIGPGGFTLSDYLTGSRGRPR